MSAGGDANIPPVAPAVALRRDLIAMVEEEARAARALAGAGALGGYHPDLDLIHRRHARRLIEICDAGGWPGAETAGEEGARAAWRIAQQAIGEPGLLRLVLDRLREASAAGRAPAWQAATLEDRIRVLEGRPQRFGTQFEPDEEGLPRPCPIEDEARVDDRRLAAGIGPLGPETARRRDAARCRPRHAVDRDQFERDFDAWARAAGWRT